MLIIVGLGTCMCSVVVATMLLFLDTLHHHNVTIYITDLYSVTIYRRV